jgi:hypothetical protein
MGQALWSFTAGRWACFLGTSLARGLGTGDLVAVSAPVVDRAAVLVAELE